MLNDFLIDWKTRHYCGPDCESKYNMFDIVNYWLECTLFFNYTINCFPLNYLITRIRAITFVSAVNRVIFVIFRPNPLSFSRNFSGDFSQIFNDCTGPTWVAIKSPSFPSFCQCRWALPITISRRNYFSGCIFQGCHNSVFASNVVTFYCYNIKCAGNLYRVFSSPVVFIG